MEKIMTATKRRTRIRHPSLLQGCDPCTVYTKEVIIPAQDKGQSNKFRIRSISWVLVNKRK